MSSPLSLRGLEITGFRGWQEGSIALDRPLTVVVGDNGCGKSSTLNAIEWCLFGPEAEKKSSGVPERAGWDPAHAGADVAVALALDGVRITRRRPAGAGARAPDHLQVEPAGPGGAEPLTGAAAEAWLAAAGFPDWTTWRRAFCQHQEVIRARLVESGDLSAVLGALLGLDEYDALRRALKDLGAAKMLRDLEDAQDALERELLARLARPADELDEEERQLAGLGIERAALRPELVREIADEMLVRARRLAADLDLTTEIPAYTSELDEPALLRWAEAWPREVRERSTAAQKRSGLGREHADLEARLRRFEVAEERWRGEHDRAERMRRERGDGAARVAELERTRAALRGATEELEAADEHLALLAGAHRHMRSRGETDRCPVCESRIRDLVTRLKDEVARAEDATRRALAERCDSLRAQERERAAQVRELEEAEAVEAAGRKALEAEARELEGALPPARLDPGRDAGEAAREEIRTLAGELERLDDLLRRLERVLDEHRSRVERLRALGRWRAARGRAARRTEVLRTPAWSELEDTIDAAAGLAVDLEALAGFVREAEAAASDARQREVNRELGAVFAEILGQAAAAGDASARRLSVHVKQTAKGLSYDLRDERGASPLATWNHASLNAVSLALLFAQAAARAARGEPAFCLLDDPGQGLDAERKRGLARAIARLAQRVPVVVATTPGVLADELWNHGSTPRRRIELTAYDARRGAGIASEEAR